MTIRPYITLTLTALFLIGLVGLLSIPAEFWRLLEWWQTALYMMPIVSGLCISLLSFCVWNDKAEIESLKNDIEWIAKKLKELEQTTS